MPFSVDCPEKSLASAVLYQAIQDWKRYKHTPKRLELLQFFGGAWCQDLCALALIEYDVMLEKLDIKRHLTTACTGLAPTGAQVGEGSTGASQ